MNGVGNFREMDGLQHRFRMRVLGLALAVILGGWEVRSDDKNPHFDPSDWKREEISGEFSVLLPVGLEPMEGKSADSIVRRFRSDSLRLTIDWGRYSDPLVDVDGTDLERHTVDVDGRLGLLVTYRDAAAQSALSYVTALHVPDVGKKGSKVRLTLIAWSASEKVQAEALHILHSIQFTPALP